MTWAPGKFSANSGMFCSRLRASHGIDWSSSPTTARLLRGAASQAHSRIQLTAVGVLMLVDHQVGKALLPARPHLDVLLQQAQRLDQRIVESQRRTAARMQAW